MHQMNPQMIMPLINLRNQEWGMTVCARIVQMTLFAGNKAARV